MNLPQISFDCIMATTEKAGQQSAVNYAKDFLEHIEATQPATFEQLSAIIGSIAPDDTTTQLKIVSVVGLIWRGIEATVEAKEMEEWQ
jgi:excinuclease UvrABC ATPase subunit